jgi:NADPH:quinone reductase-like Zn-dependent oxidoreductase
MDTTTQLPLKQKAWLVVRRGAPKDAVVFSDQVDVPSKLAPGEVLIKVQAAAFNPVFVHFCLATVLADTVLLYSGYKLMGLLPNFMTKRPHVAEHDFAGIVINGNGTRFENGQEVYGQTGAGNHALLQVCFPELKVDIFTDATVFKTGQGTLAEYLVCSSDRIVLRPPHLKPTEASGLSLVGLTAYQALFNVGKLEQGQSVFINGGGTSVGLAAIQLAKATGCVVGVSASAQKEELMRSLGVDTVRISYRNLLFYTHWTLVH